jgi:hypothetical protein
MYVYNIFFICLSVVGHLGCLQFGYLHCAAINIGMQVSLLYVNLHSFVYIPKSGGIIK